MLEKYTVEDLLASILIDKNEAKDFYFGKISWERGEDCEDDSLAQSNVNMNVAQNKR